MIKYLHNDLWRFFGNMLGIAMDFNLVVYQRLVPRGAQSFLQFFRDLALIEEDNPTEWVRQPIAVSSKQVAGLVDIRSQLVGTRFWKKRHQLHWQYRY